MRIARDVLNQKAFEPYRGKPIKPGLYRYQYDLECNLVFISTKKIFKDTKICSLEK